MTARVLWIVKGLGPGGAETLLVAGAGVHDRAQFQVSCAYVRPDKDHLVPELRGAGVEVHCLSSRNGDRRWPLRLISLIRSGRWDIIHVHSPALSGISRMAGRTMRQRPHIVTTQHNSTGSFDVRTRLTDALTAPLDDARISVSQAARDSMWAHLRNGTEVLNHGVDLSKLESGPQQRNRMRESFGVRDDQILVVTVANFRPQKDYPNLLEAARQVLVAQPDRFVFVAVGQGPLQAAMTQLHRDLGLDHRVRLAGHRADATAIVAAADLFVLASRVEGRPVALMEALALGRACVVTAAGGVPEMVQHDVEGHIVPIADPQALAEAVLALGADDQLRSRYAAASARRGQDFDIRRTQHRIETIYHDLIARSATRRAPLRTR